MRLPKDGQEYIRITLDNFPVGATAEASIDRSTWTTIAVTSNVGLYLCRGPLSGQTSGTLISTGTDVWVRITGTPEQIVRRVGLITLY